MSSLKEKNKRTAKNVSLFVAGMFALAFASFPLYNLFCKVTGYGGKPKTIGVKESASHIEERVITVRFNADKMKNVPWVFKPEQKQVDAQVGENKLIFYTSENLSDQPFTGMATYNIVPEQASPYFHKVHCFCFDEQTLAANEKVDMPVSFYIDTDIMKDRTLDNVKTITLSYTFFKAE